jgi:hypothetical protein
MPFTISKTDGQTLVVIPDGTADTTHSSLTLFGKNYAGYGPILDMNFVKLLENFSFNTAPQNPLEGQLWWDSSNKVLQVRQTNNWKIISGPTVSPSPPASLNKVGDLWYDSDNYQLKVNTGSAWSVVGPDFTAGQGVSGAIVADIPDVALINHTVVLMYVGGVIQAVMSKDPTFMTNNIIGFSTIRPGWNLLPSLQYYGDANNALNLGSVAAANYLRSDIDSTTDGMFSIATNDGLNIGSATDFSIKVTSGATKLINNAPSKDTELYSTIGGVPTLGLRVSGTTGLITVAGDPTTNLGVSTKQYVDSNITTLSTATLKVNGSNALAGNIVPNVNNVYSVGSAVNNLSSVYAQNFIGNVIIGSTGTLDQLTINDPPSTLNSATNKQYVDDVIDWVLETSNSSTGTAILNLIGNAPPTLNTLGELANAINNTSNFGNVVMAELNAKAPISSPAFIGAPIAPTVISSDVSNKLATTAFVHNVLSNFSGTASFSNVNCGSLSISNVGITTVTSDVMDIGSEAYRFNNVFTNNMYGNVMVASQPFITSVGTLSELNVEGDTVITGNLSVTGTVVATNLVSIDDFNLTLAKNATTVSQANGSGIIIGGPANARFTYNSTLDDWESNKTIKAPVFDGVATRARYADLAERYVADYKYDPGTVLEFGGDFEVTKSTGTTTRVAGVVSTRPAFLMNSELVGENVVDVALQGRCPVFVVGPVRKGDCLVAGPNGKAVVNNSPTAGTILGKSLQNFDNDFGKIEISISRS